jgi:hypothetical protein
MNREDWMRKTMACLLVLLGISAAAAAFSPGSTSLRIKIPFDFTAGNQMLPAGVYNVSSLGTDLSMLQIKNQNLHRGIAIVRTVSKEANDHNPDSRLVFNRYGDQYFLSQVWSAGQTGAYTVPRSSREKELATELSGDTRGPEVVSIAALTR